MQNDEFIFPQAIYRRYLTVINGIPFTSREIDVIACLLHMRGTRKIASLLNISPNTVITHIKKIKEKLQCNSRESILDFVENSLQFSVVQQYYLSLVIYSAFENALKACSKRLKNPQASLVVYCHDMPCITTFENYLQLHLKLTGIEADVQIQPVHHKKNGSKNDKTTIIVALENEKSENVEENLNTFVCVDINEQKNYYFSVFEILKKLCPNTDFERIIFEFKRTFDNLGKSSQVLPPYLLHNESTSEKTPNAFPFFLSSHHKYTKILYMSMYFFNKIFFLLKRKNFFFLAYLFIVIVGLGILIFQKRKETNLSVALQKLSVYSDLITPEESVLLSRSNLLAKIDSKFKPSKGIQTIALVGPGGTGKTILARYYAQKQNVPIAWEMNAETKESLLISFRDLAYRLSQSLEDKRTLAEMQEIKNIVEKEIRLIDFVREKLKFYNNWLLIYDNLELFPGFLKYFPRHSSEWGNGRVLITTRDGTLQDTSYISAENIIFLGELKKQEAAELFIKIIYGSLSPSNAQKEKTMLFLEGIPSFPLDISLAAYYIKNTNITPELYLERLSQSCTQFEATQEVIAKGVGEYAKTRCNIIILSLERLINIHKDFSDLLLLISFLDSQNIPRDILNSYKSKTIIDNFIYHLKKYSLIHIESSREFSQSTLSMHRSTQAVMRAYLAQKLELKKNEELIILISNLIDDYVNYAFEKEDIKKMQNFIPHLKMFLSHKELLPEMSKGSIEVKLGCAYFYTYHYGIVKNVLEDAILLLMHHPNKRNYRRVAQALACLGNLDKELGAHENGKQLLEKSLSFYEKYDPENYVNITRVLTSLGDMEKNLGNHDTARNLLEKSLFIAKTHLDDKHIEIARTMFHLGIVHRDLGNYEEAIILLQNSLHLLDKYYPDNYSAIVRALKYLGNTYRSLGRYKEAKDFLEQSINVCEKYLPSNQTALARSMVHLATVYKGMGNYEKAITLLNNSLTIHNKLFGEKNVRTYWVVAHLANTYRELGEYEKAHTLIQQSLKEYIEYYQENNFRTSWIEMQLGHVYIDLKKYSLAKEIFEKALILHKKHFKEDHIKIATIYLHLGNTYRGLRQYGKAKRCLQKSLVIYEKHYGKDHIETAHVLEGFGKIFIQTNELNAAETFFNTALDIFQANKHPWGALILEDLGGLYLQKAQVEERNAHAKQAEVFKVQAIDYLKQSLEKTIAHFPKNSSHIKRIQEELHSIHRNTSQ